MHTQDDIRKIAENGFLSAVCNAIRAVLRQKSALSAGRPMR